MSALATLVKAQRTALGLAQGALPGLDQSTVSKIESGKLADPGIGVVQKLAKALGLSVEELTTGRTSAVQMMALRELQPDPANPRQLQADDAIDAAFMQSIKDVGLIQPLTVRLVETPGAGPLTARRDWMVVDGHRRYAALIALHGPKSKIEVPCRIVTADAKQTLLMQLVANVQRADMNPWDLARAIGDLVNQDMDTQAIADALGRKRRWVQEMASVGRKLYNHAAVELAGGRISISQAIAIAAAEKDEPAQRALVERVKRDNLNEDDIRAIVADAKATAAASSRSRQLDIEELAPPKGKRTTAQSRWTHRRGHIEIVVQEMGAHEFAAVYDFKWRNAGGSGGVLKGNEKPRKTAAIAFLVAVRQPYEIVKAAAKLNPEDIAAAIEAHAWVAECIEKLGGTPSDLADWRKNNPPPEKPAAKKAAVPKPKALEPIDISEPPSWARPIVGALFMFHTGQAAYLCKGWRAMAKLFADEGNDQDGLRELYDRRNWQDDANGEPFDFGSCVVRLIEAPQ